MSGEDTAHRRIGASAHRRIGASAHRRIGASDNSTDAGAAARQKKKRKTMDAAEAISAIARIDPPLKQPELAARYTTLLMDHGVSPVKAVVGALRAMDRPYKQILLAVERRHRGVVQHWSDLTEHLKVDGVGGLVRFLHELERGQQK